MPFCLILVFCAAAAALFLALPRADVKGSEPKANAGESAPEEIIWNYLLERIGNPYGVAGLMGNLYAESTLHSNNLQNSYERKLKMTDDEYTRAVDDGTYDNFVRDAAGYGLAQWTFWSRKEALLNFARERGTSIGDLGMQLDYLWYELSEKYPPLAKGLREAASVREASDLILLQYERPANQSEEAQIRRAGFGQRYYEMFAE